MVRDNKAQSRFELDVEGGVAFANYRITPAGRRVLEEWSYVWTATRNFVDTSLEGQ